MCNLIRREYDQTMKNTRCHVGTFIKATGVAGLAAAVAQPTRAQKMDNRQKIRVGLIGAGGRGTRAGITDCAQADRPSNWWRSAIFSRITCNRTRRHP